MNFSPNSTLSCWRVYCCCVLHVRCAATSQFDKLFWAGVCVCQQSWKIAWSPRLMASLQVWDKSSHRQHESLQSFEVHLCIQCERRRNRRSSNFWHASLSQARCLSMLDRSIALYSEKNAWNGSPTRRAVTWYLSDQHDCSYTSKSSSPCKIFKAPLYMPQMYPNKLKNPIMSLASLCIRFTLRHQQSTLSLF